MLRYDAWGFSIYKCFYTVQFMFRSWESPQSTVVSGWNCSCTKKTKPHLVSKPFRKHRKSTSCRYCHKHSPGCRCGRLLQPARGDPSLTPALGYYGNQQLHMSLGCWVAKHSETTVLVLERKTERDVTETQQKQQEETTHPVEQRAKLWTRLHFHLSTIQWQKHNDMLMALV